MLLVDEICEKVLTPADKVQAEASPAAAGVPADRPSAVLARLSDRFTQLLHES
jgi:hypothetical protein